MRSITFTLPLSSSRHFHCRRLVVSEDRLGVRVNEVILRKHFTKRNIFVLKLLINDSLNVNLKIKNFKFEDKAECVVHVGSWRIIIDKASEAGVMVQVGCVRPETEDYCRLKYKLFDRQFMGVLWRDNSNRRGIVSEDEGFQSDNDDNKPPLEDFYF